MIFASVLSILVASSQAYLAQCAFIGDPVRGTAAVTTTFIPLTVVPTPPYPLPLTLLPPSAGQQLQCRYRRNARQRQSAHPRQSARPLRLVRLARPRKNARLRRRVSHPHNQRKSRRFGALQGSFTPASTATSQARTSARARSLTVPSFAFQRSTWIRAPAARSCRCTTSPFSKKASILRIR